MAIEPVARFLHAKAIKRARRQLGRAEEIQAVSPGNHRGKIGTLVVTERRILWVPKRWGRVVEHPRHKLHELRRGETTKLIDSRQPAWQVSGIPAGDARQMANVTGRQPEDAERDRARRAKSLFDRGIITEAEYRWMQKE